MGQGTVGGTMQGREQWMALGRGRERWGALCRAGNGGEHMWGGERWGAPFGAGNSGRHLGGAGNSGGHSGREGNDGGHSGGAGNGGEHTGVPLTVLRQVLLLNFRALVEVPEACRSSRTGPHVAAVAPST